MKRNGTGTNISHETDNLSRSSLLDAVSEVIRVSTSANDLLYNVSRAVGRNFGVKRCLFNEIDLDHDVETVHRDYFDGVASVAGRHKISLYSSLTSAEMAAGRTVVNSDSQADERTAELFHEVYAPAGERAYVAVPLMRESKWVASLWLSCDTPRDWTSSEVALLELIAERSWLTVEKLRNEAARRESEELFSNFMRHLPGLAWIKDRDGRYLFVNDAAEKAFATTRDRIYGSTDGELFPAETAAAFRENDIRVLEQLSGIQTVETLTQDDGEVHHSLVSKFPVFDPAGQPTMVGGMAIDVTEQQRAAATLREREGELKLIADMTPIVLARCGSDLVYKFINRAGAALFDLEPEQIVGRSIVEVMGDEAFALIRPYVERALNGEQIEYELEVPYPTGPHWMRVNYVPERSNNGEVVGWLASIIDETELHKLEEERRAAEESLIRSQQRFQLAQKAGRVGIWDWNIAEGTTYWSETTWDFYGESPGIADPNDEFWTAHLHPDDRERVKQLLLDLVDSTAESYKDEFRIIRGDGTVLWIESNATFSRDQNGRALRLYGVNIDMTERRQAAQQLQRAHDELELRVVERTRELAESNAALIREAEARIAGEEQRIFLLRRLVTGQEIERRRIARDIHDQLGQRLTALRLKLESLRTITEGKDATIHERVERIQEIAATLDEEVSFLAWELRPSVLDDLGLVEALRAYVKEWSAHYEIPADFQPLRVGSDRFDSEVETHLYRIAQESLNNVSKYAEAKNVTVVLERRERELLLIVEDDGVGFDVTESNDSTDSGGGLGLVGMNERASLIGGELDIESSPAGTTVYARIPVYHE